MSDFQLNYLESGEIELTCSSAYIVSRMSQKYTYLPLLVAGLISSQSAQAGEFAGPVAVDKTPAGSGSFMDSIIPDNPYFGTNLEFSKHMLSWQRGVTDHSTYVLDAYERDQLQVGKVYLSGHAAYAQYFEETDVDGKFPVLGRFPDQHTSGGSASENILESFDLSLTYSPHAWVTMHARGIYTELEFPGQEEVQLREAFVTLGNLKKSPYYVSVGKKTVNFGSFVSYNPNTHSVGNHFYRTDSKDVVAELGYRTKNLSFAFTTIQGGRQLRVADTPGSGFMDNFAVSGQYNTEVQGWDVNVGAGYLNSTIYDSDSANHPGVTPDPLNFRHRNGAYNAWLEVKKNNLSFHGEYTKTERDWPASGAPVESYTVQAAYDSELFSFPTRYSLSYGRGKQGNPGDAFERLHQFAAGIETFVHPNFSISAEYVYNRGFVPLIMLDRVSDSEVDTNTLIISGRMFF